MLMIIFQHVGAVQEPVVQEHVAQLPSQTAKTIVSVRGLDTVTQNKAGDGVTPTGYSCLSLEIYSHSMTW